MRWPAALLPVLGAGCGTSPPAVPPAAEVPPAGPSGPADTLVLRTASGATIWLAEGRAARDSAGGECFERSVEIRTDSTRVKVPLLFVTRAPTPAGPDAVEAELSRACRTMAVYRVDLATGRPVKVADR